MAYQINKNKYIKKQVKVVADKYQNELKKEIDEFRELNGRDKYNDDDENGFTIDEKTGEVKESENNNTVEKAESLTDPECGMFLKGEHERQFAYVDQVACDKKGWILGFSTNPGICMIQKLFYLFLMKSY